MGWGEPHGRLAETIQRNGRITDAFANLYQSATPDSRKALRNQVNRAMDLIDSQDG